MRVAPGSFPKLKRLHSRANRIVSSFALVLLGGCAAAALASNPSGAIAGLVSQRLPGSLAPVPFGDALIGPASSSTPLSLEVTLDSRDPAALSAMAQAVSTPGSPQYREFLSAGEFAHLYGPTPATIATVTSALEAEGLSVGPVSGTGLSLPVTATVAQAESAFATPIVTYLLPSGVVGYDNTAAPSVPTSIASQIQGVLGLDTLNQPEPIATPLTQTRKASANARAHVSPLAGQPTPTGSTCVNDIGAVESNDGAVDANGLAQAYSFTSLYSNNDYGSGSTVALVELAGAGYSSSDLSTFANCYGITLGGSQITEENVDGGSNTIGGGTVEAELDIETVLSMAPQANIKVYEGNQSIYDVESQIVSDDTAKVVSISWGACEADFGASYQQSENTLLEEAALDGQTVFASAGDDGSEACNVNGESGADTGNLPGAQALNSTNGTLYVANAAGNTVSAISEATDTVTATITTGSDPDAVLYDAATSELYVANYGSDSLTEVSTTNCNATASSGCAATASIPSTTYLDGPNALALDGSTVYVSNVLNGTVAVLNASNNSFVGSITLPATSGVATPDAVAVTSSHLVYAADSHNAQVDHFNGATCNATTQSGCSTTPVTVSVVAAPDSLALDATATELFVAGSQGGISVLSTSSNTVVATISTTNVTGMFYGTTTSVESVAMSPNGQDVLATVAEPSLQANVLATINPTTHAVLGTVDWNTGTDTMGQIVSDPSRDLVWDTDASNDSDALEDFNLGVSDPASQPEVTGVGGTTLSALGPAPTESVWNDNDNYASGAGGGGISQEFAMPNFQMTLGEITGSSGSPCANSSGNCREVPDVAADADPYSGYVVYDDQDGSTGWTSVGGTSAASPLWAGALADISTADAASTSGFGSLNPDLYSLAAASPGMYFNDVTSGNNDYNDANGSNFSARNGYDMATGLGTPIVSALATGLNGDALSAPGAPALTSATAGNAQVVLHWTAPTNNGGSPITGYDVLRGTSSGGESVTPIATLGVVLTYTNVSLTNGVQYFYEVEAVNSRGRSVASNELAATPQSAPTVPGAPTIGTPARGNASVTVNWTAPENNGGDALTGYSVKMENVTTSTSTSDACPSSTTSTSTSCTVASLINGDVYTFSVAAINAVGTGSFSSSSTSVTPSTVPGAPTIGAATPGNAFITVNWTAPGTTGGAAISGYSVSEENVTTSSASTDVCPSSTTSVATNCAVSGLTQGNAYTFSVAAINAAGTGAFSGSSASVTDVTAPGVPTSHSVVSGFASATVSWNAPTSTGGSPITGYSLDDDNVTTSTAATDVCPASVTSTATTCTVTGLTDGDEYTFSFAAINAVGTGAFSAPSGAALPAGMPGAPTIATPTAGNASATVYWIAPSYTGGASIAITGYSVTAQGSTTTTDACANSTSTSATSCIVTGLTNGQSYTFTVAAINEAGTGTFSNSSIAVTPSTAVPGAPTIGPATGGDSSATVTWTAPSVNGTNVTGYTVSAFDAASGITSLDVCPSSTTSTSTSCIVTGLTNTDEYQFYVAAMNASGTSPFSSPSNEVTPAASGGGSSGGGGGGGGGGSGGGTTPTPPSPPVTTTPTSPPPTMSLPIPREVTFPANGSALSAKAKTLLTALSKKLEHGAIITVTGYAYGNASLAKKRAKAVADYLESKVAVRVNLRFVTTRSVPKVVVTTTRQ